jgi:glycosyltransferase involved in cell wall biosynthesis
MRLLILAPEYDAAGGIATYYRALAPALRAAGVELHIIEGSALNTAEEQAPRLADGIAIETLERHRVARWWHLLRAFSATPGLRRHLAAAWAMWEKADFGTDADIVEASDWGLLFIPPAVEATRPLIVQCHGSIGQIADQDPIAGEETQDLLTRLLERSVLSVTTALQTTSLSNAAFWRAELGRDIEMIRPAWGLGEAVASQSKGTQGLVIGRVQRWKGPQVVCTALGLMGPRAPKIEWFGRDVPWQNCHSSTVAHLATAFPKIWGKKLIRHAAIPKSEVIQRQKVALFNLIPSTWDVLNLTVIEAMASGRPAIVSTGAGASELVEDGVNGFLFPAGDAQALAATMERVMGESPARLADIGMAAQETVRASLDPDKIAAERFTAYRNAIDNFKRNPPAPLAGWLGSICRPSTQGSWSDMAFLDQHPLRSILAHSGRRLGRRIWLR